MQEHQDFCESIRVGKAPADDRVEASLYRRATGYSYETVKIFNNNGQELVVPYTEHVPPCPTSMIFWLKNRKAKEWRDRVDQALSNPDGSPLNFNIALIPAPKRDDE